VNCINQTGILGFDGSGTAAGTFTAVNGSIVRVQLTTSGTGYSSPPNVVALNSGCTVPPVIVATTVNSYGNCRQPTGSLIFTGGGGYGATGSYTASGGTITSITLTSGGRFYTSVPRVSFSDSSCTFDDIDVVLSDSSVAGHSRYVSQVEASSALDRGLSLTVGSTLPSSPSSSTNYNLSSPTLSTSSKGSIAPATSNTVNSFIVDYNVSLVSRQYIDWNITFSTSLTSVKGGSVTQVTVLSTGSNCLASSGTLSFEGGGGSGALGNYTVSLSGSLSNAEISLISTGGGYMTKPTVRALGLVCTTMPIFSVVVSFGGSGCTGKGTLLFSGGGGYGAKGRYTALNGALSSVTLTHGGAGYVSPPTITLSETGCVGYSIIPILSDAALAGFSRSISSVTTLATMDDNLVLGLQASLPIAPSSTTTYTMKPATDSAGISLISGNVAESSTGSLAAIFVLQTDVSAANTLLSLTASSTFSVSSLLQNDLLLVGSEIMILNGACNEASPCTVTREQRSTLAKDYPAGTQVLLIQRTLIDIQVNTNQFGPFDEVINLVSSTNFVLIPNDQLLVGSTGEMIQIATTCQLSSSVSACSIIRAQPTPLSSTSYRGGATGVSFAQTESRITFVKRPPTQVDGPVNFTLSSALNQADTTVSLLDGPTFTLSLLTDGDTLLIAGEVVRITGVCGVVSGVCPILRGQLGTISQATVPSGTEVFLHTPFSSSGFLSTASTYPVDYHVSAVSGQYVGWNLTLSTSVASVAGTAVTQIRIARMLGCGCSGQTGALVFSGGGGSGATGTYLWYQTFSQT